MLDAEGSGTLNSNGEEGFFASLRMTANTNNNTISINTTHTTNTHTTSNFNNTNTTNTKTTDTTNNTNTSNDRRY